MRIDYESMIGKSINSAFGEYKIISYEGKDSKKIHWYTVRFVKSGNEYAVRYSNLNEKLKDIKVMKADRVRKHAEKVKQRSRLSKTKKREYKRFDFAGKKVLALDMSTTSTGWSILTEKSILGFGSFSFLNGKSKAEIEAIKSSTTTINHGHEDNADKRLRVMFRSISELLRTYKPDIVIFEGVYLGLSVTVLKQLMKLQGFVIGYCLMKDLEYECIEATSWQHYHGFSTIRELIKRESVERAESIVKTKIIDDIADSINMGIFVIKSLQKNFDMI